MFKITIEDKDLNKITCYKHGVDVDIFIERHLADSLDPDSLIVNIEEIGETQLVALRYLNDTDWYSCRQIDDGTAIPGHVGDAREEARGIL